MESNEVYVVASLIEKAEDSETGAEVKLASGGRIGMLPVFATLKDAEEFSEGDFGIVKFHIGVREDGNAKD